MRSETEAHEEADDEVGGDAVRRAAEGGPHDEEPEMSRILVCDDEPAVRFAIAEVLSERGHEVVEAASGESALAQLEGVDVLVTDLSMPVMDGLELLQKAREREPGLPVIVVTARGSERAAVLAMKGGAHDYLTKPFDVDELALAVARAAEHGALRRGARIAAAERATGRFVLGDSAAMRALTERLQRVASRDVTTLILGETGTGKELVATMLHALSPRHDQPIVRFNCAAVPADLAEAELFGHAKGAFTGAAEARVGYFTRAHRGTLVLDEIGELPLAVQPKLLRALQEGEVQPLGASRPAKVDVRIVASTHRDLREEVQQGRFREDLFFRLAVVELRVPPLRARREDIGPLARAFAARYAERFHLEDVRLDDALVTELTARDWPGNVRELENTVQRLVALSADGAVLGAEDLRAIEADAGHAQDPARSSAGAGGFRAQVDAFERRLLIDALTAAGGNRAEAARRLGLSRVTMLDRMKRLGVGT